jgi:hypothetical protein
MVPWNREAKLQMARDLKNEVSVEDRGIYDERIF